MQEIFIDLWTSARRFDPARASEETFVAMIARRRLIDGRRKTLRRPATNPLPETLTAPIDENATRLDTCDEARRAAQALAEMGDPPRRILTMAIYTRGRPRSRSPATSACLWAPSRPTPVAA